MRRTAEVWKPATEVTVAEAVETVPEGGLYVVNDEGERKATGAYYTPDYVVTYIVEETVGPLVDEIRDDLREQGFEPGTQEYLGPFLQRVTDLKILDPAMGSAHFLTSATGFLAEEVMSEVRDVEEEMGVAWDEQFVRREIAKDCIYGVDVNGMAVELGKLSMWLETLAADRPLAFLDHHLKHGNSLVGSDVTEVLSNGEDSETDSDVGGDDDTVQTTFQYFERVRKRALDHVMDMMQDLLAIDNETLDDIKSMEGKYAEIRDDPLYQRLLEMTNVHTAEEFGVEIPDDAYETMAHAIEDEEEWEEVQEEDWFVEAQRKARVESFFHWELEFPGVFFNVDGEKRDDAGFDAVIGNPPYVKIQNLRKANPELADYSTRVYQTASGRFDIYALFVEKGVELTVDGRLSYILPNKFFESGAGDSLRQFLVDNSLLSEIIDFGQHQVFDEVTTYTCLLSLHSAGDRFEYGEPGEANYVALKDTETVEIEIDELSEDKWALTGPRERRTLDKIRSGGTPIGELSEYLSEGIVSGDNKVMFVDIVAESGDTVEIECPLDEERYEVESDMVKPLIRGDFIERYGDISTDEGVIYAYEVVDGSTQPIPESQLSDEYPRTYDYLTSYEERLRNRGSEGMEYPVWYALWCPREKQLFDSPKLVVPDVCQRSEFTADDEGGTYLPNSAYGIVPKNNEELHRDYLLAVLNASPTWFFIYYTSPVLRGDFRRFMTSYLSPLPIPDEQPKKNQRDESPDYETVITNSENSPVGRRLADAARVAIGLKRERTKLNLSLLDHLGVSEGRCLVKNEG